MYLISSLRAYFCSFKPKLIFEAEKESENIVQKFDFNLSCQFKIEKCMKSRWLGTMFRVKKYVANYG